MNNFLIFISLALFISSDGYAKKKKAPKVNKPFKITMEYSTKLNYSKTYVLTSIHGKFYANGLRLSNEDLFIHGRTLRYLVGSKQKIGSFTCYSGAYSLKRLIAKKPSYLEKGCIEDERFRNLISAFDEILAKRTLKL